MSLQVFSRKNLISLTEKASTYIFRQKTTKKKKEKKKNHQGKLKTMTGKHDLPEQKMGKKRMKNIDIHGNNEKRNEDATNIYGKGRATTKIRRRKSTRRFLRKTSSGRREMTKVRGEEIA